MRAQLRRRRRAAFVSLRGSALGHELQVASVELGGSPCENVEYIDDEEVRCAFPSSNRTRIGAPNAVGVQLKFSNYYVHADEEEDGPTHYSASSTASLDCRVGTYRDAPARDDPDESGGCRCAGCRRRGAPAGARPRGAGVLWLRNATEP